MLAIFLLFTALLGWQAKHFEIDASADTLLMKDDPNYVQTRVMNRRFSPQEFLLVAYEPRDRPLLSRQTFEDLKTLSDKIRRLERVESVRSILDVPLFARTKGGLSSLEDPSRMTMEHRDYSIAELKEIFRGHPLYEDLLINREQTATALQVLFRSNRELEKIEGKIVDLQVKSLKEGLSDDEERELKRLKAEAEPIEKELNRIRTGEIEAIRRLEQIHGDIAALGIPESRYTLSSLFVLYKDILQQLFRSQILTLGIVYVVLTLTFLAIFRSFRVALVGIAPNILSTLGVLAVMGWLGIPLDLMTITIAAIAMGIAVDDTIHYIHRYLEELKDASADEAIERSHATVGHAILYTSFIVILGFSLLAFSDFVPSVLFGLLTGLAMLLALVFALCLLPVLLNRFVRSG